MEPEFKIEKLTHDEIIKSEKEKLEIQIIFFKGELQKIQDEKEYEIKRFEKLLEILTPLFMALDNSYEKEYIKWSSRKEDMKKLMSKIESLKLT